MKIYILIVIIVVVLLLIYCNSQSNKSLPTIQTINLQPQLQPQYDGPLVTYYYNPGCPHCRNFMGAWKDFSSGGGAKFQEVNCSLNPEKCTKVKGVPYIVFSKSGNHFAYNGNRDTNSLREFLKEFNN
jgi:hypothetical protein